MSERDYLAGKTRALVNMLQHCQRELDYTRPKLARAAALQAERAETVAVLRRLCKRVGAPTDWPDNLHLGDVVEKYLARHILGEDL